MNHAVAIPVSGPDAAIHIHRGARRIQRFTIRRRFVFTFDFTGFGINADDGSFFRIGYPQVVKRRALATQRHFIVANLDGSL